MRISGDKLSIYDVYNIAVNRELVQLDQDKMQGVKLAYDRVQAWGTARFPIYGVNTGFGELVHVMIPPNCKTQLQVNLLRSHAAGAGQRFPDEVVRAIMAVRLNCLMKGYSGVAIQTVKLLQHFLNRGIHPVVPQQGSLGASGDLAPLSHMALPLIGEGYVSVDGNIRESRDVLREEGVEALQLGFKEALALVNGTSAMTGVACLALVRAITLLKLAVMASADFVQCLGGSTRAFHRSGHELKNHLGQIVIAHALEQLLSESRLTCDHTEIVRAISAQVASTDLVVNTEIYLQNAYSLRCVPQILGPVLDTVKFCRQIVEEEVNSCNDNPLIMNTPEETFHGGNFHGQYVAMASDYLNIAITEIGVLAERQLNRLVDPHLNGNLPAFLAAGDSGLFCGFEGGQYLATSLAAENLDLSAPMSVKSIPSNGSNQDVVSMGLISARKSLKLCDHVRTMVGCLVAACHQAAYFIGEEKFSEPIFNFHKALTPPVSIYRDSIPIAHVISQVETFVTSEQGVNHLERYVDFSDGLQARAWHPANGFAVIEKSHASGGSA